MMQSNWEAVKALALDTTTAVQQQPTSPSHDAQSAAQVSCFFLCLCFPGACMGRGGAGDCYDGVSGVTPGGLSQWGAILAVLMAYQPEYVAACSFDPACSNAHTLH